MIDTKYKDMTFCKIVTGKITLFWKKKKEQITFYMMRHLLSTLLLPHYLTLMIYIFFCIIKPGIWKSVNTYWNILNCSQFSHCPVFSKIQRFKFTKRYGPLRGPTSSSCGGLRPRLFLPFGQKKSLFCCFGPFLAIFGVQ